MRIKKPADASPAKLSSYGEADTAVADGQDVATVWAKREPLGGDEQFLAGELQGNQIYKVWIRYRDGIDNTMWLEFLDGLSINIANVNILGPKVWLELLCRGKA